QIMLLQESDAQVRRIYMDVSHSHDPKPSWYGESVGHYEGDELVVDTIGMNDKSFVDNYRTPHTTELHVVERFTLIEGGKFLEATILVEDVGAFTMPWTVKQRWRRREGDAMIELICAENHDDHFGNMMFPIPEAAKADF